MPDGNTITIADGVISAVGSGGGEPNAYIKDASVSGNTLTLTKKDDTEVVFTPSGGSGGVIHKTLPKGSLASYINLSEDNKAWIIDWANNTDKYIVDVDGCKVISTLKSSSIFYYYYFNNNNTLSYYYINFTDNNFTEISSNQPTWSTADTQFLTSTNWSDYITLSSSGDWQNTTTTSDSSLYNAKEVVIFWKDSQDNYRQTYLNVGCDY